MAWKAQVVDKAPDYRAGTVVVTVQFFDDVEPTVILHEQQFVFEAWNSLSELVSAVKKVGASERRKRGQVDVLASQITVGAEVPV